MCTAEENPPIHANFPVLFNPTTSDSSPPMLSPAMARSARSVETRYSASTRGMISVSSDSWNNPVLWSIAAASLQTLKPSRRKLISP